MAVTKINLTWKHLIDVTLSMITWTNSTLWHLKPFPWTLDIYCTWLLPLQGIVLCHALLTGVFFTVLSTNLTITVFLYYKCFSCGRQCQKGSHTGWRCAGPRVVRVLLWHFSCVFSSSSASDSSLLEVFKPTDNSGVLTCPWSSLSSMHQEHENRIRAP